MLGLADDSVADEDQHHQDGSDGEKLPAVELFERDQVFHGSMSLLLA